MGRTHYTESHEIHEVRCASCSAQETIRIPIGGLQQDHRFNARDEYTCELCRSATLFGGSDKTEARA